MKRWHIRKQKAKWWKITFPWNDKMVKVRVNRRMDILNALKFLGGTRDGSDCAVPEPEAMFIEGAGWVLLEDYLIIVEDGA